MGGIVLSLSWGSWRDKEREGGRGREGREKRGTGTREKVKREKKRTRGREKKRRSLVDGGIRGGVNHRPFLVVFFLCSGLWNPSIRLNCPGRFPSKLYLPCYDAVLSGLCFTPQGSGVWFL